MFDYQKAFERNLGWLNPGEQERLRNSCVAIAGLGGAGGFQAQALARLGVGHFKIADPDIFEWTNLNRQIGATAQTIGHPKTEILRQMIRDINPEAVVDVYRDGISPDNIDFFLENTDLVIDGIDFFALETKLLLFRCSREKGKIVLTSCPVGFGASLILFSAEGMSFEEYFDFRNTSSDADKKFTLAFGLSPTPLCLSYMNERATELEEQRAASVCPGLMLVGAITGTEAVKILTGKGKGRFAPYVYQTDLHTQRAVGKYYPGGMKNPWMRLKKWIILRFFLPGRSKNGEKTEPSCVKAPEVVEVPRARRE